MFLRSGLARFILFCGLLAGLLALPAYAAQPTATVVAPKLNVRSGPGTNYAIIGSAAKGTHFTIVGQASNCSWLKVVDAKKQEGWLAGASQYVSVDTPCNQLPAAAPPPNTPPASQPTATPAAKPTPKAQPTSALPVNQGCYLFQNQLGAEVTVTITGQNGKWTITFKVPRDMEQVQCFAPGRYTFTLDAPPPWNSVNGEFTVKAGDHYYFPLRGRK
ncbi:MAG: SH3 domain-containing protein [Caldilineaceae bacterium]